MDISLDYFKKSKRKEVKKLLKKEARKKKKEEENIDKIIEDFHNQPLQFIDVKPYMGLKLVNDILTVTLNNGDVIVKPCATQEDFINIRNAKTEEDIFLVTAGKEVVEERKQEKLEYDKSIILREGVNSLAKYKDFIIKDESVYIKGTERSIPQLVVEKFLKIVNNRSDRALKYNIEYNSLKKFWLKCCLNPSAQSAEDLYTFLSFHQFKIDKHGNFYAYRRVVSKGGTNKELVDFISNTYNKVKAVWKKNPIDYAVYINGEYTLIKISELIKSKYDGIECVGNLKDLYLDLLNMGGNSYTDAHTHSQEYKIGSVISMPRDNGDDNNNVSCSKGYHQASKEYDYSSFGDTPILTIINPIDVLAVPLNEVGKLRVCRWFFAMTLSEDEQHILDDDDFDVTELGDIFEEKCNINLTGYVQNSFAEEVKRHTFKIPEMSGSQINKIVKSLGEMKDAIKSRVQKVL